METIMNLFDGRIGRRAYIIRSIAPSLLCEMLRLMNLNQSAPLVFWVITLAVDAFLTVQSVKRFHDIGHKGMLAILMFVPGVNEIMMLYLWLKRGEPADNVYGPNPYA